MGISERQIFCPQCQKNVLGRRQSPTHILHALLFIFTCCFWVIPWFFITISANGKPYRCPYCGYGS
jgi:hypothetical protein